MVPFVLLMLLMLSTPIKTSSIIGHCLKVSAAEDQLAKYTYAKPKM